MRVSKKNFYWTALVVVVAAYALLLWRGPWWLDRAHIRHKNLQPADGVVITGVRTALVALGAGVVAGIGLYYTHRSHRHAEKLYLHSQEQFKHAREKDREQAELTREGQVTDRYVEAIKLLSSEHLTQQLGGIYALERIMRDSEKDFSTVVKVLAAYVRMRAPRSTTPDEARGPEADVQAALTVLARRPRLKNVAVDLSETDLRKADLRYAFFDGGDFKKSRLDEALLGYASLKRANFSGATLDGADLTRAQLVETYLDVESMVNANLVFAAIVNPPILTPKLFEARLSKYTTAPAELPEGFQGMWDARVKKCDANMVVVNEPEPWPGNPPEDQ
ncbi:pentapeptide repeat-containing protein [Streptomyces silvensis]|uniref:pentapeptide repeat-containing protein n=1 Tax=Streptomyces silvensis TaxID=1765722 RepID=UPI00099EC160|nr:pentapeptide repeat-containing protein [Streptomyces silvensis]